ncbi:TPA: SagB/ThcOx family dehydrogenase [Pseudomonas aeruginosa]|uniref:SagB/ThcOx family dehydrogenase n=1 Tax=Pseudomonas aeruginosa TaxID=287 RepID=UPI00044F3B33|nr:SagB/ThcOx family dehydrogenase [Pseudomonas aeruginosa]EZO87320.1 hypothetical protein V556_00838 [Pseudomonas aeruginosa BWH055]MBW0795819.1 SagB/ThcOx family dehydrogenase [Pseudomonas aeruginosa]MBX6205872.1 SagB/ThcOx family dehydrogenase [Pseudomonas aeruginosa]WCX78841.1 SagB/ThcOx family dehydrogenase [Pseudomonas aeruginosa]HCF2401813.1 SagB/ThcOx family dehydrogenase [Pseudomonas aeruginosa]
MQKRQVETDEPATLRISGNALHLSDGVGVTLLDDQIVLENRATGASKAFSREAIPLLDLFMDWIEPDDFVSRAFEQGGEAESVNRAIGVLHDLLELDVLTVRAEDLRGTRLRAPGAGWSDAMRFLLATRTSRETVFAPPAELNAALAEKAAVTRQASAFMEYPAAPFSPLSEPRMTASRGEPSFPKTMLNRRTARRYADHPLTEAQLSSLLKFAWGMIKSVPNPLGDVFVRKTSPSGGSLHPVEVYPIVLNVDGIERGIYHYSVRRHGLERLWTGDAHEWIAKACGDQEWVREAAVIFLCSAFLPRTAWKYDFSRVARAVMAEIGFSGQSLLLTASWLGLGAFTTIALRDELFEDLLGFDPLREPVFAVFGVGALEPDIVDHSRPRTENQDEAGAL